MKLIQFYTWMALTVLTIPTCATLASRVRAVSHSMATVAAGARTGKNLTQPPVVRGFVSAWRVVKPHYFHDARSWGADVLRLQLHPGAYARNHHEPFWQAWPSFLDQLVLLIRRAQRAGLKIVLDLHDPPYNPSTASPKVAGTRAYWKRPGLAHRYCHVWRDIVSKTAPWRSSIYGYDLYNEPHISPQPPKHGALAPPQWRPLAIKIIETIRELDEKTWIIYEVAPYDSPGGFGNLTPLPDTRVLYSVHFYNPWAFTAQGLSKNLPRPVHYPGMIQGVMWNKNKMLQTLEPVIRFQDRYHVPIYVGEFSVICWAPQRSAARWLRDAINIFEAHHWSWTYHAFGEWPGWDLRYSGQTKTGQPRLAGHETSRAKVIRAALAKNQRNLVRTAVEETECRDPQ